MENLFRLFICVMHTSILIMSCLVFNLNAELKGLKDDIKLKSDTIELLQSNYREYWIELAKYKELNAKMKKDNDFLRNKLKIK